MNGWREMGRILPGNTNGALGTPPFDAAADPISPLPGSGQGAAGGGAGAFGQGPDLIGLLAAVWLSGVILVMAYGIISYIRLKRRIRFSVIRDGAGPDSLKGKHAVYETDRIPSPFVCGFLRPAVYLPLGLEDQERAQVLRHEEVHIRRRDYLIKPLAYFALALHWFNPLIWLGFALMVRDMEMSCDEKVLKGASGKARAVYGETLLRLATTGNGVMGAPLAFGENNTKGRVKNVLKYKKSRPWLLVLAVVICVGAGILCLTDPAVGENRFWNSSGNHGSYEPSKDGQAGETAKALYENRTPYVGDNSKVGSLVNLLPLPESLEVESIQLHTGQEPYGLTIHYQSEIDDEWLSQRDFGEGAFRNNDLILLACIDNLGYVEQIVHWNDPLKSSAAYQVQLSREEAEDILGGDVREYAKDAEGLKSLLERGQEGV